MKATITEKTYYLITRPDTNMSVENHHDRIFFLKGKFNYGYSIFSTPTIGGDPYWKITKENILLCGAAILEQEIESSKPKPKAPKKKGWFTRLFDCLSVSGPCQ